MAIPQWMLDKIATASQEFPGIRNNPPSALFHEVPEAEVAQEAGAARTVTVSDCAQSVNGFQVLTYTQDLTGIVVTGGVPVSFSIGNIPTNGMVIGSAVWASSVAPPVGADPITLTYGLDVSPFTALPSPSFIQLSQDNLGAPNWYSGRGGMTQTATERGLTSPHTFLNFVFSKGGADSTFTSGVFTLVIYFIQMDPNNSSVDGYPTGGVLEGPCTTPLYPIPSGPPAPAPEPIQNLQIFFDLLQPGAQGYGAIYKPTFSWTFGSSSLATKAMIDFALEAIPFCPSAARRVPIVQSWRREAVFPLANDCPDSAVQLVVAAQQSQTIDQYLNFYLSEQTGVTPEGEPIWTQLMQLTHQPIETSTPLGFLLNPFPFLLVNETYKIEVEEVVHVDGFPELTTTSTLLFYGDPYPAPPPPIVVPPGPPGDLVGQGGTNLVLLTWDPPSDTGGTIIDSYKVEQAPDNGAGVPGVYTEIAGDVTDLFYLVQPLEGSTTYWFRVSATNSAGTGDPTTGIPVETGPDVAEPPSQPLDLVGIPGQIQVQLSWKPPTYSGGEAIVGYLTAMAPDTAGSPPPPSSGAWVNQPPIAAGLTKTITGLTANTKYWFRVYATNTQQGPWTVPIGVTTEAAPPILPSAPLTLVATGEVKEVKLSWAAPSSTGGSPITDYQIDQAPDAAGSPGAWTDNVQTVDGDVLTASISSLTASTTYWFRVSAKNAAGFGPTCPPADATTKANPLEPPSAPRQLVAKAGIKEATLTWLPPNTTGGQPLVTYQIQRSATSATAGFATVANVAAPAQKYTDPGLTDDTEYWWRVAATNNPPPPGPVTLGPWSNVADATTFKQPTAPDPPTDPVALGEVEQVAFSWKAPLNNGGSLVTSYTAQFSAAPAPYTWVSVPAVSDTKTVVTGLLDNTQYWFHALATNAIGSSAYSTVATTKTSAAPATVPSPPKDLVGIPGVERIQLNWKAPDSSGGKTIIDYKMEMSSVPSPYTWTTIQTGITDLTFTKTSLADNTEYWFRVFARNSVGYSNASNVDGTTTLAAGSDCDLNCTGTVVEWNGTTGTPVPVNGSKTYPNGIGSSVPWSATGMIYGVPGTAKPPGPGCVTKWDLTLRGTDGSLIATWSGPDITFPRSFYVVSSKDSEPGKDPNAFIVSQLKEKTTYIVILTPVPQEGCPHPPILPISIITGSDLAPPPVDKCDSECKGKVTQWDGTVTASTQINGTDKTNPNHVAAEIHWSDTGMTFGLSTAKGGPGCVAYWNLTVSTTATPPVVIATTDTQLLGVGPIIMANFQYPPPPSPSWVWEVPELTPDTTYNWTAQPVRSDVTPGCATPPAISTTFKMGNPARPKPPPGPPVPPLPDTGNLPQIYITTYGIPSWGQTPMVNLLSQQFFSTGKSLTAGKNQNAITVAYQQQQNWAMVRSWAKAFFHQYAALISQNEEMVNAMILIGDWATLFPAAGLPVQASNLADATTPPIHGQVAGSQANWDITRGIYSYCSPNGPVDFGLSYNPDSSVAPPAGVSAWWADDPDQIGCPLILDFFIPLAQIMKAKKRVIEISVNGDVSKNGNADNYHSLDAGNYTAADQRRGPFARSVAPLELIVLNQQYTPTVGTVDGYWGPITTPTPTNKTQTVSFAISSGDYATLIAGTGKPGDPISQNNNSSGTGQSTTGTIVSSTYAAPNATFTVNIPMSKQTGGAHASGKREDGFFTITDTDPAAKYQENAQVYFAAPIAPPTNPKPMAGYDVTNTDLAVGIFRSNWVIQQSTNTGTFPGTNAVLDPASINNGGIVGQIPATTGAAAAGGFGFSGTILVQMALEHGLTDSDIKVYLTSAPTDPPVYDTNFTHRAYQVPSAWLPGQPIPPPAAPFYLMRIATIGIPKTVLLPTIFNYTTIPLLDAPNGAHVSPITARALGPANTTPSTGGWLPNSWDVDKGNANFPAHWNVSLDQNQLPEIDTPDPNVINAFADPGALIMGGGNVFIGTGVGPFAGRASYFDASTATDSTTRPELVTIDGTGAGGRGTYLVPALYTGKEVGFPLDNLHQLYVLIYRINQKVMKFNWTHSKANPNYDPTSKYAELVVPMITHVHHDKESYQVNKDPEYPVCDPTTGEIETTWLMLGKQQTEINAMEWNEFLVWKQSRRQTSVAYEKYLFNRYMPAQYLPDWRTGGTSSTHAHYMPLNTGCHIPNTGNSSGDGSTATPYTRTGGELLWDPALPWNVNQQRNFSLDADPNGSRTSLTVTRKGIGNYSNDFNDRRLGDTLDGIQRYQLGWVNYTVTAWTYSKFPANRDLTFTVTAVTGGVIAGLLCLQPTSGATGIIKSASGTSVVITTYQGAWTPTDPITVYTGTPAPPLTQAITAVSPPLLKFTSQGANEAYQELYNIGEVKPPVGQLWLYDTATVDANKKPVVPSPLLTLSVNPSGYVGATVSGGDSLTAIVVEIYNTSSVVITTLERAGQPADFPYMFSKNENVVLTKPGKADLKAVVTEIYKPTAAAPFPKEFIDMPAPASSNVYGTGVYALPKAASDLMIPNGLGSACIPGNETPACPSGISVICPNVNPMKTVGPYYRLNCVTNTLIGRIFSKYSTSDPGGSGADWPFLGANAVNVGSNIKSPALTDLWLRFDAKNSGIIPLDGRGFKEAPGGTGVPEPSQPTDGSYAPLSSPWVATDGKINLSSLYADGSQNNTKDIIQGTSEAFALPVGPRQAIALFANEYIGGALTTNPSIRPGAPGSGWKSVTKGDPGCTECPSVQFLPGTNTGTNGWIGSRGMEVYVYNQLITDPVNAAMVGVDAKTSASPFTTNDWKLSIRSKGQAATDFDEVGFSDAANGWGGEYNGLSALQGEGTTGFKHMKNFLKSCGSMMTGVKEIGKARVGLYTLGFLPETWWATSGVTNYSGDAVLRFAT